MIFFPSGSDFNVPIAQWIERQVADLKVGGSSPPGDADNEVRFLPRNFQRKFYGASRGHNYLLRVGFPA